MTIKTSDPMPAFLEQIDLYIIEARVSAATKAAYRSSLRLYVQWCRSENLDPFTIKSQDILRYRQHLERTGLAVGTINHRLSPVSELYWSMVKAGRLSTNPVRAMRYDAPKTRVPRALNLAQVHLLFESCRSPLERALVGLLTINGLNIDEVANAQIEHLAVRERLPVLLLPNRKERNELPFTVLPPIVNQEVTACKGRRSHGPLILTAIGSPLNRHTMRDHVHRLSKRAGFEPPLNLRVLKDTMRVIAVQHGFSAASIVRAVSETDMRRIPHWVASADLNLRHHAAWKVGRLIELASGTVGAFFDQADDIIYEAVLPATAAVTLAASAFEHHLRGLCLDMQYPTGRKQDIVSYISYLREKGLLTEQDVRLGHEIAVHRDRAAHGWFETVRPQDAEWVIRECREFVERIARGKNAQAR